MDIAATILQIAQGEGAIKTKIMYRAFLSFPQLKEYMELLTEQGLLEQSERGNVYMTTEKGHRFLKLYKEIDSMVPKENMLTKFN